MESKESILDKNGFDFTAFEYENEYSAKNILISMEEYKNSCLQEAIKKIEETNATHSPHAFYMKNQILEILKAKINE